MKKDILKVFAVLRALVMLFASCGGKDKDTSETTGTSSVTEKNNQAPTVIAGAKTNGKDGSAKSGGKDPGKDSGKSDDNSKSTGSNTSETSKPSGGKTKETTSTSEREEKDNEGEFVIPPERIHLPIVEIR